MSSVFPEFPNVPPPYGSDSVVSQLKLPPHSIEAEVAVLGALLLRNEAWDRIGDKIKPEDFYRDDHRRIYRHIVKLIEVNKVADALTVAESLKNADELGTVGGIAYLQDIVASTASAANIHVYADLVRDRSVKRELARLSENIADSVYAGSGKDASELLNDAEKALFDLSELGRRKEQGLEIVSGVLGRVMTELDDLSKNPAGIAGLPTGFVDFDELTTGLHGGDLVIVAGRPSMGKTTVAMNFAEHAAVELLKPTLVFSMEMGAEQLAKRSLSSISKVDATRLRTGHLDGRDWDRLNHAMVKLNQAPLLIDPTPALNPLELRARARRAHRQYGGLGLIVIDYLQLMSSSSTKGENRTTEISEISRSLKALAKELNVPVVALSQLNRSLEQRVNKRPVMSDLRESGAIEQDADLIVFVYRDEVYNPESMDAGIAELIVAKQRNGPIGTVKLTFMGHNTRFENHAGGGSGGGTSNRWMPSSNGSSGNSGTSTTRRPYIEVDDEERRSSM